MSNTENIIILLKRASKVKGITMAGLLLDSAIEEAKLISFRNGDRPIEITDTENLNGEEIEEILEAILEEQRGE